MCSLLNKTALANEAPVHVKAPIAIGIPVKPNKLVKTIELNGVIPVTGITSPNITANAYGLSLPTEEIAEPICLRTAMTPGEIRFAKPNVIAGANKITTIKSSPSGTFFSMNLIPKATIYAAMNAGNNF